jgi:hypothetical protein
MSALSIVVTIGATAVTTLTAAFFTYLFAVRKLHDEYELEQQRELRTLMGGYTGRMLEAAIDWDRRMTQLYDSWEKPHPPPRKGEDPDFHWHVMCPGWADLLKMDKRWWNRVIAKNSVWGKRLVERRHAKAAARYRRHPKEYFYLSVVFRFMSLLAIARRFEAEAFYLDARHAKNNKNELYFLQYAKSFLWAATHSGLSPDDGVPARDHFLSDKLRPMLDRCYKDLGAADSKAPKGEPIFDWDRFLHLINLKTGLNKKYDPDMDRLLEFFDRLRPVDYIDDKGDILKRRRWERLICLHLLTLNFIETFGFDWQAKEAKENRALAIKFLSMDNTVIEAFLGGIEEWLGLEDQEHMKSLRAALKSKVDETHAIPNDEIIGHAVARLIGMGAQKEADPAVMREKGGLQFTVDPLWLKNVRWRAETPTGAGDPGGRRDSRFLRR